MSVWKDLKIWKNVLFQTRLISQYGSINMNCCLMWKNYYHEGASLNHILSQYSSIFFIYKLEIRNFPKQIATLNFPLLLWFLFNVLFNPTNLSLENCFFFLLQSVPIKECLEVLREVSESVLEAIYKRPRVSSVDWIGKLASGPAMRVR